MMERSKGFSGSWGERGSTRMWEPSIDWTKCTLNLALQAEMQACGCEWVARPALCGGWRLALPDKMPGWGISDAASTSSLLSTPALCHSADASRWLTLIAECLSTALCSEVRPLRRPPSADNRPITGQGPRRPPHQLEPEWRAEIHKASGTLWRSYSSVKTHPQQQHQQHQHAALRWSRAEMRD